MKLQTYCVSLLETEFTIMVNSVSNKLTQYSTSTKYEIADGYRGVTGYTANGPETLLNLTIIRK